MPPSAGNCRRRSSPLSYSFPCLLYLQSLFIFFILSNSCDEVVSAAGKIPHVHLLYPPARLEEGDDALMRLPEMMCPTPRRRPKGTTSAAPLGKGMIDPFADIPSRQEPAELFSGERIQLKWHNADQIRSIDTRIELLTGDDAPAIIQRLDTDEPDVYDPANESTSKWLQLPAELECFECVLRLTLELPPTSPPGSGAEVQIHSCADIRIVKAPSSASSIDGSIMSSAGSATASQAAQPATSNANAVAVSSSQVSPPPLVYLDCANNADCASDRGKCYLGGCYCHQGYYGRNCYERSAPAIPPKAISGPSALATSASNNSSTNDFFAVAFPGARLNTGPAQPGVFWRYRPDLGGKTAASKMVELAVSIPLMESGDRAQAPTLSSVRWFAIGYRPLTDEAILKCRKPPAGIAVPTKPTEGAHAQGVPSLATRRDKGENSLTAISTQLPSIGSAGSNRAGTLAIHSLGSSPAGHPTALGNASNSSGGGVGKQQPQQKCGPNEVFAVECPEYSRECEPSCEWTAFPETVPTCPRVCGPSRCVCAEGFVRLANDKDECKPFGFCQSPEVVPSTLGGGAAGESIDAAVINRRKLQLLQGAVECPKNETLAKCGRACEPSCESMYRVEQCNTPCPLQLACTCRDDYVRATPNGTCIFWGDCPNLEERFLTSNTGGQRVGGGGGKPLPAAEVKSDKAPKQSRVPAVSGSVGSSPPTSGSCSANETMNECGRVCEPDCWTIFTREICEDCGQPACACKQGYARGAAGTCVYWGDCPLDGTGLHTVAPGGIDSGINKKKSSASPTNDPANPSSSISPSISSSAGITPTPPTGLTTTTSGGSSSSNATSPQSSSYSCQREFRHPPDCRVDETCDYYAKWEVVDHKTSEISIEIHAKGIGRWTGIGFSPTGQMRGSDIITGWVYGEKAYMSDRFAYGQQVPPLDAADKQDVHNATGWVHDDIQVVRFTRPLWSHDEKTDLALDGEECLFWLFPVGGGRVLASNTRDFQNEKTPIGHHDQHAPVVSEKRICLCDPNGSPIKQRSASMPPANSTTTASPNGAKVSGNNADASNSNSSQPAAAAKRHRRAVVSSLSANTFRGDPFYCNDLLVVEVLLGNAAGDDKSRRQTVVEGIRVTDAFTLDGKEWYSDEQMSGKQSFVDVSSIAWDGAVTVMVRRAVNASEFTDQPLVNVTSSKVAGQQHSQQQPPWQVVMASGWGAVDLQLAEKVQIAEVDFGNTDSKAIKRAQPMVTPPAPGNQQASTTTQPKASTSTTVALTQPSQPSSTSSSKSSSSTQQSSAAMTTSVEPSTTSPFSVPADGLMIAGAGGAGMTTQGTEQSPVDTAQVKTSSAASSTQGSSASSSSAATSSEPAGGSGHGLFNQCGATYTYDAQKNDPNSYYHLEWRKSNARTVDFHLHAKVAPSHWTGIGFSKTGRMANSDAIVVSLASDGQTVAVMDYYSANGYGRPVADRLQDVFNIETAVKDGVVSANFSRSLTTGDTEEDEDLDGGGVGGGLPTCQHLIYLYPGGPVDPATGDIERHIRTPVVSEHRACIGACGVTTEQLWEKQGKPGTAEEEAEKKSFTVAAPTQVPPSSTTTEEDTGVKDNRVEISSRVGTPTKQLQLPTYRQSYDLALHLPNENWTQVLAHSNSTEHRRLSERLTSTLQPLLTGRWPRVVKELRVLRFTDGGSVLALMQLQFEGPEEAPSADEVKSFLRQVALMRDVVNDVDIDAEAMQVQETRGADVEDKWGPLRDLRNWSIAGGVILVLAALVIFLFVCSARKRGKGSTHPSTPPSSLKRGGIYFPASSIQTASSIYLPYGGAATVAQPVQYPASPPTVPYMAAHMYGGGMGGPAGTKDISSPPPIPHQHHYSPQSPNMDEMTKKGTKSKKSKNGIGNDHRNVPTPHGVGETTYQEWFAKVASKDAASHFQEAASQYYRGNQRGIGFGSNGQPAHQPATHYYGAGGVAQQHQPVMGQSPQQQQQQSCYVTYPTHEEMRAAAAAATAANAYYTMGGAGGVGGAGVEEHGAMGGGTMGRGGSVHPPPAYYNRQY